MARRKQAGFSLFGMLLWGGVIAVLFVVGAQVAPTVIEYMAVRKAAHKAAHEGQTVTDIRSIFDRAAQIDDIKSITGRDLEITKEGDRAVVIFAWKREIHLAGPAYLVLKYEGRTK